MTDLTSGDASAAAAKFKTAIDALLACDIEDRAALRALFENVRTTADALGEGYTRSGHDGFLLSQMLCVEALVRLRLRDVNALRERVATLEQQQKDLKYRGVWQPAESYSKGNWATYDGSLWVCIADAPGKPGVSGWQLAAKRGADGKDASRELQHHDAR